MMQSRQSNGGLPGRNQVIALLLPDLVDCTTEYERLRKTFDETAADKRLLVCIPDPNSSAEALLSTLKGLGVEKQFLLGHEVEKPQTDEFVVKAPPGIRREYPAGGDQDRDDLIEFALALSDVVLVSSGNEHKQWAQYASNKLNKTLVTVGSSLPPIPLDTVDVTKNLDPEIPGWHSWGSCAFGRFEQFWLECLALCGWGDGKKRKHRLRRIFGRWYPDPYFAPGAWQDLCPDKAAVESPSELIRSFNAMDRSASHGSYIHRDVTWITHIGVALAVLSAVAGYGFDYAWLSWVEVGSLLVVLVLVLLVRRQRLQDRWTACRFGAEQLRIMRMSLPLLVLPPAFATVDVEESGDIEEPVDFQFAALTQLKRAVRQQGLPRVDYTALTPVDAARWVQLIVGDQMHYHEHNHHTLERAERSLAIFSTALFVASMGMAAVLAWTHEHGPFALLLSAGAPAFAAALHGAGTRLGFVHRSALSREMHEELKQIFHSLDKLIRTAESSAGAWPEVRAQAYAAAKAMGAENTSWVRLVRRYRDELP